MSLVFFLFYDNIIKTNYFLILLFVFTILHGVLLLTFLPYFMFLSLYMRRLAPTREMSISSLMRQPPQIKVVMTTTTSPTFGASRDPRL